MANILVIYHTITGNVGRVAEQIAEGAAAVAGTQVVVKSVETVEEADLLAADGIAFGSPKYYGSLSPEITRLFERAFRLRDRMLYKVGTAFSASPSQYGGQEQVHEMLFYAMMNVCNMVAVGEAVRKSGFIGGYTVGEPDAIATQANRALGERLALVAQRMCEKR